MSLTYFGAPQVVSTSELMRRSKWALDQVASKALHAMHTAMLHPVQDQLPLQAKAVEEDYFAGELHGIMIF